MTTELKGTTCKKKWFLNYKKSSKNIFSFSYADQEIFESEGVELGIIRENSGLTKAVRPHFSVKTAGCSVDSEILIPFGSEPRIKRKCENIANHFRITTDISVPSKIAVDSISVDPLKIKGDWTEIDIYTLNHQTSTKINKETFPVENLTSKGLSFKLIPIAVVFRNNDGLELEIGAGYDLWRWNNSQKFDAESIFVIKKLKDSILFERKPFVWKSDHEISKYNFRFTWYFSWVKFENKTLESKQSPKRKVEILDLINNKLAPVNTKFSSLANVALSENFPEAACSSSEPFPCFASRQTENLLKNYIRSTLSNNLKNREKNLTLRKIQPQICFKGSHLERAKSAHFAHWDYFYIMAFFEWANRFLSEADKNFHIAIDENSIMANLPSAYGLANL
ncbi:MAG TPA: hypothetical protein DD381_02595 [Lentisphaeria bacterium]|nr:MAG: hypothetical protein A2X47_03655 [Lentisphaerae bacterium GWF2_38_69]HBM15224.1 hypothetical protein [Lentisphaeria bacterium]